MGAKKQQQYTVTTNAERLLVNRRDAAMMLGTSVATILRLERAGELNGVRLRKSVCSSIFYPVDQIGALAANAQPAEIARAGAKAPPRRRPGKKERKR
jgi:hypothetical protein